MLSSVSLSALRRRVSVTRLIKLLLLLTLLPARLCAQGTAPPLADDRSRRTEEVLTRLRAFVRFA